MASVLTFNSLQDDVLMYCERVNDPAMITQFPRLVMLAENRLAAEIKGQMNQIPVTGVLSAGQCTMPKPPFWRESVSFTLSMVGGGKFPILSRNYEYVRGFWPDQTDTGKPRFYADYDANNILIAPTPDVDYPFEMVYYARLMPLDSTNQTNWFTMNAPQVLFCAVMVEAQMFLKNADSAQMWQGSYDRAMAAITGEDNRKTTDRTNMVGK